MQGLEIFWKPVSSKKADANITMLSLRIKDPITTTFLVKRYARCSGATNQTLLQYYYAHEIEANSDDFSKWQDLNRLRRDQKNALSQFKNDSERDIRFIEFGIPEKKN
jgi:hypothetical protein